MTAYSIGALQPQSAAVQATDRDHPEVDRVAQTAVQPNLLVTEMVPRFEGREIQKPKIDRFFDLVDEFPGEKEP